MKAMILIITSVSFFLVPASPAYAFNSNGSAAFLVQVILPIVLVKKMQESGDAGRVKPGSSENEDAIPASSGYCSESNPLYTKQGAGLEKGAVETNSQPPVHDLHE